jgi:hypothetical protein
MGAMAWHDPHQKAKNSTNCILPEANFTVSGSLACNPELTQGGGGSGVGVIVGVRVKVGVGVRKGVFVNVGVAVG